MTEEELRKEATTTVEWECTPMIDRPTFVNGYVTGSKPREQRITELEAENAKTKGLLNEMLIALKQTKDGKKYNVSLIADVEKLLGIMTEIEKEAE